MRCFIRVLPLLLYIAATPAQPLPSYNTDISETSVSGISSGGYMALQFAVANSNIVSGIGVFAGGPYRCAADGVSTALGSCMQGQPDHLASIAETEEAANSGLIAPLSNIANQRVWLFSGYNDGAVKQTVMNSLYDYVTHYTPTAHVYYQNTLAAGHAMVTQQHGAECQLTGGDFINDCDYDAAGLLLQHIYGKLSKPASNSASGQILTFDQSIFTDGDSNSIGMAKKGYLYVPDACTGEERCRIHVAFHGCRQYAKEIGDNFYRHTGYNQWAENNRIIILYPQTLATSLGPFNPKGCWDWWGYNGPDFAYRNGAQIKAVRTMLEHLSSGFRPAEPVPSDLSPELLATDSTSDSVSLAWASGGHASGYILYRATDNSNRFERINSIPKTGASFVDKGLSPDTRYSYRLASIADNGSEQKSNIATIVTRPQPPHCDPYFNDNVTHVSRGRAFVMFGFTFAKGSWDYMGLWNLLSETALFKVDKAYQVGVCPVEDGR